MAIHIQRREFIVSLSSMAAWPLAARAQQADRMRRIGLLMNRAADNPEGQDRIAAFHQPGNPDAAFIEETHRQRQCDQSQDVGRRRDDGGQDKNQDDGVRPGAGHKSVSD